VSAGKDRKGGKSRDDLEVKEVKGNRPETSRPAPRMSNEDEKRLRLAAKLAEVAKDVTNNKIDDFIDMAQGKCNKVKEGCVLSNPDIEELKGKW